MSDERELIVVDPVIVSIERTWYLDDLRERDPDTFFEVFHRYSSEFFSESPRIIQYNDKGDMLISFKREMVKAKAIQITRAGIHVSPILEDDLFRLNLRMTLNGLGEIKPDSVEKNLSMYEMMFSRFDIYIDIGQEVGLIIPGLFKRFDDLRNRSLKGEEKVPEEVLMVAYIMGVIRY